MTKSLDYTFLEPGHKILVVHRRLFPADKPRFFVGAVDSFNEQSGLIKATGFSFYPQRGPKWTRKTELRTKIMSLTSGTLMVYVLPLQTDIQATSIINQADALILSDGANLNMDLSEPAE